MKSGISKPLRAIAVVTACALTLTLATQAQENGGMFPSPISFDGQPEGVAIDKYCNIYVSVRSASDQVWKVSPSGAKTLLADLGEPGGGAGGLATDPLGNVYIARAVTNQGVYRVGADGSVVLLPGTDNIVFPNALAFDHQDTLYVTETFSAGSSSESFGPGGIWRVLKGGTAELWLRDELLTGLPPSLFPFPVGANGIGLYHGDVYVINTDKALVIRIPVRSDGSAGQPEVWKKIEDVPESLLYNSSSFPVLLDGLVVDAHGNVYVAVISRNAIVRINAQDRSQETVAIPPDVPLDTPASLAFGTCETEPESLFITNLGMFKNFIPDQPWPGPGLVKTSIRRTTGLDRSPAGSWVISAELSTGTILMLDSVQAQDLSGTHYGGVSKQVNVNPTHSGLFPDVESGDETHLMQMVRTGPDSFEATHLTYGISTEEDTQATTKLVIIVNEQWRMTGPDTVEGDGTAAVYLTEQDFNGDGLPDEGEMPTVCVPFAFAGNRLHVMPGCEPTPMSEHSQQ